MKELIVIIGTLLLGCFLFYLLVGDEGSLKVASERVMERTIEMYREQ